MRYLVLFLSAFFVMTSAAQAKPAASASTRQYQADMHKMHRDMEITYTDNADVDFVNGMIPHHIGAVDMAMTELHYGKDPEMLALAQRIIRAQKPEINYMSWWKSVRGKETIKQCKCEKCMQKDEHAHSHHQHADARPVSEAAQEYQHAMHKMHQDMNITYTGNADVDFARGMIPHHQGAIDMARTLKRHGMDMELSKMADGIISSQQHEIGMMKDWLASQGKGTN